MKGTSKETIVNTIFLLAPYLMKNLFNSALSRNESMHEARMVGGRGKGEPHLHRCSLVKGKSHQSKRLEFDGIRETETMSLT